MIQPRQKVFILHSPEDRDRALWVARVLTAAGGEFIVREWVSDGLEPPPAELGASPMPTDLTLLLLTERLGARLCARADVAGLKPPLPRLVLARFADAAMPPGWSDVRRIELAGWGSEAATTTLLAGLADAGLGAPPPVAETADTADAGELVAQFTPMPGHQAFVCAVSVSADGRRAVSASFDKTLKVWDLEAGREARTLAGHARGVWSLALAQDGRRVISGALDGSVRVWDVESGVEVRSISGQGGWVQHVALAPDGRLAVAASLHPSGLSSRLAVWDLETGTLAHELRDRHQLWIKALALTPDGTRAISGAWDRALRVWNLAEGREQFALWGAFQRRGGPARLPVGAAGRLRFVGPDGSGVGLGGGARGPHADRAHRPGRGPGAAAGWGTGTLRFLGQNPPGLEP